MSINTIQSKFYAEALSSMDKFKFKQSLNAQGSTEFTGKALPGTSLSASGWLIVKFHYDDAGNFIENRHVNGIADFTNVWDDRGSYIYL